MTYKISRAMLFATAALALPSADPVRAQVTPTPGEQGIDPGSSPPSQAGVQR
jgi:hypothetical protein